MRKNGFGDGHGVTDDHAFAGRQIVKIDGDTFGIFVRETKSAENKIKHRLLEPCDLSDNLD